MNKQKRQNFKWLWWVWGIFIFFCIVGIILFNNNEQSFIESSTEQILPLTKQALPIPVIKQVKVCTNFEYSDWSHCSTDGTQNRVIVRALPEGCNGGNPVQFQNCKYEPLSPSVTGSTIYQKMINQIKSAPNQTISTNYIAGTDAVNTTDITWQVKDDGLYLHVKVYRTSHPEDQSSMILVDTNFDGQPEWISDRGQPLVEIFSSDQYYKEIILSWGVFNSYFASYLLK